MAIDKSLIKLLMSKDSAYLSKIRTLFKFFEIKLKIQWNATSSSAFPTDKRVELGVCYEGGSVMTITDFISVAIHELTHILNLRDGKFELYHRIDNFEASSSEEISVYIRTAIKAEKYTDMRAARICKLFFPEIKYSPSYNKKHIVRWYKDNYLSEAYDSMFEKVIEEEDNY